MDPNERLAAAREALTVMAERCACLVEDFDDTSIPIPGSEWTVREAAVHMAGGGHRHAAMAEGEPSLLAGAERVDREYLAARMRSIIADNPETDAKKLADQIREGYEHFLAVTATVPADQPIIYHAGRRLNLAVVASAFVGESVLHGYDLATAGGVPWPIDPGYAALALGGYYRIGYSAIFQPLAGAGLEATYHIDTPGTDPLFVQIADGTCEELPAAASVDCVISADPVTALLVTGGRLSQWPAIALGRMTFTGGRPEIGPKFFDLFVFP